MTESMKNINFKSYRTGQIIEGTVIAVTNNEVFVDFGYFTEGTIYLDKLTYKNVSSCKDVVSVGDKITAKINKINDEHDHSQILLSRLPIEEKEILNDLKIAFKKQEFVKAQVIKEVRGGYNIKVNGLTGFMPKSETFLNDEKEFPLENQEIEVKIIEIGKRQNPRDRRNRGANFVVSRKAVILHNNYLERVENFNKIEVDAVYEGEVVRVEDYGVLVLANNYQGLVPLREISHLPFNHVSEVLKVGDKVNVKVLEKDEKKLQVLYSIKALLLKPWEVLEQEVKPGDVVTGKVVRMTDFGAFINIMPMVDGLLHVSEYSHNPSVNLHDEVEEGAEIEVKVLSIDTNRERLSLSVKALKDNPWETSGLKRGNIIDVKVIDFKDEDAVIEYVEDVIGILPKNQITREKRITNASDELEVGQEIQVKVIDFDARNKQLVVSIRRIKEDEERQEFKKYMQEQEEMKNDTLGDILGEQLKEVLKRK